MSKGLSTRSSILNTAIKMASVSGIEGVTLGNLAKAVGMSKSGLYAHFRAKDHLQIDVLEAASERFTNVVIKPALSAPRGEPRIRAMFENWMKHLDDRSSLPGGSVFITASIELDDKPGALRNFVQKKQKELMKTIAKSAQIAVEEKHFREDTDREQFAWSLYSFVLGYHHFKRMLEDPKAEEHLRNSFEGLIKYCQSKQRKQESKK